MSITFNEAQKLRWGTEIVDRIYIGTQLVHVRPPSDFTGLVIWLDASRLTVSEGAVVNPWPNFGSGPAGVMVGYPLPRLRKNARNGRPVVQFSMGQSGLRFTGIGVDKTYTLFVVARNWKASSGRILTTALPPSNSIWGWWSNTMDLAHEGDVGWYAPNNSRTVDTSWQLYSSDAQQSVSNPRLFINGVYRSTSTPGSTGGGLGNTLNISGYDAALTESADAEVAEVIVYNRKLSDAERQKVEMYMRTKWGL